MHVLEKKGEAMKFGFDDVVPAVRRRVRRLGCALHSAIVDSGRLIDAGTPGGDGVDADARARSDVDEAARDQDLCVVFGIVGVIVVLVLLLV